jgi:Kdo2-lipid IVA lauroyltransferase/acyltransferase
VAAVWPFIPRKAGLAVFGFLGRCFYLAPTKDRLWCRQHLRLVFGAKRPEKEIQAIAKRVYAGLGKNLFDALYLSRKSREELDRVIQCDDLSALRVAYAMKRGVLTVTAHTGCFEMLLHYFAAQGFACFAIGRELYDRRIDELVKRHRSGENIVYCHRSEHPRRFVRLLQEGRLFGVLVDQDTDVDGVFAHFLGRLAYTPSAAVKLALRFDIPTFVVTTARQDDDRHRIFVREVHLVKTENDVRDLVSAVETINGEIGKTIMAYPHQWVWMHRRWRRKPTDEQYRHVPSIENVKVK